MTFCAPQPAEASEEDLGKRCAQTPLANAVPVVYCNCLKRGAV